MVDLFSLRCVLAQRHPSSRLGRAMRRWGKGPLGAAVVDASLCGVLWRNAVFLLG